VISFPQVPPVDVRDVLISKLQDELSELRSAYKKFFTNTNHGITMKDRNFSVQDDGEIFDENFDYDACIKISGDFAEGDKVKYAQMICSVLNTHLDQKEQLSEATMCLDDVLIWDRARRFIVPYYVRDPIIKALNKIKGTQDKA
jgi:hypothetical protein